MLPFGQFWLDFTLVWTSCESHFQSWFTTTTEIWKILKTKGTTRKYSFKPRWLFNFACLWVGILLLFKKFWKNSHFSIHWNAISNEMTKRCVHQMKNDGEKEKLNNIGLTTLLPFGVRDSKVPVFAGCCRYLTSSDDEDWPATVLWAVEDSTTMPSSVICHIWTIANFFHGFLHLSINDYWSISS